MRLARHPFSAAVPDMTTEELDAFRDDLEVNGQLDPVTIYKNQVLDGWHRYTLLLDMGVTPRCTTFNGNDAEAAALVCSRLKGRSISVGGAAMVAEELARLSGSPMSLRIAAETMGVSEPSAKRARKIASKGAPEVREAVRKGEVSLNDGAAVASLPHEEQVEALEAKRNGETRTLKAAAGVRDNGHGNGVVAKDERLDAVHVTVPDHVLEAFETADRIAQACHVCDRLAKEVETLAKSKGGRLIHTSIIQTIQSARKTLHASKATHVCPYCQAKGSCDVCKGEGWTSASYFDSAPPEKKAAMKKKGAANVPI